MRLEGGVEIRAPRERVWAFLLDPDEVRGCLPAVRSVERLGEGRYAAEVKVGVGFLSLVVPAAVAYERTDPPAAMTVTIRGAAHGSTAEVSVEVRLDEGPGSSTYLAWAADVEVGGALASLAPRLLDGPAPEAIAQALDCARGRLEALGEAGEGS